MMDINDATLALLTTFEGEKDGDALTVNLDPYLDPIGIWTIGYGHAIRGANGQYLRGPASKALAYAQFPGGITHAQAVTLLHADVVPRASRVQAMLRTDVNENQFGAMCSLVFNIGESAFGTSTLLRYVNSRSFTAAALEFQKWNRAGGVIMPGLVRRRAAEARLFATPT